MIVVDTKSLPRRAKLHLEPVIAAGYGMTNQTKKAVCGLCESSYSSVGVSAGRI